MHKVVRWDDDAIIHDPVSSAMIPPLTYSAVIGISGEGRLHARYNRTMDDGY
jgi:hypothetical protein